MERLSSTTHAKGVAQPNSCEDVMGVPTGSGLSSGQAARLERGKRTPLTTSASAVPEGEWRLEYGSGVLSSVLVGSSGPKPLDCSELQD
ncbi:hypothetical protein AMTR_s00145p00093780 [Amborella trichopoda]|uniref:Uncharacterized protein n=1 Tax=Amborella trichopoda TaxID=13333 RepID=W1PE24_AMBTC|nr:hypothetical protein AMTR_s00145p00093780 [Amborella trichopoda]